MSKNSVLKGTKVFLTMLLCFVFSDYIQAQKLSKKFSFGFGFEAGALKGDDITKQAFDYNGGITLRASIKAGPGFITVTGGAIAFKPTDDFREEYDLGYQIPVKLGYKFIFLKHLFIHADAGYSQFGIGYKDDDGQIQTFKTGGFTIAPAAGVNFGPLELAIRYEKIQNLNLDELGKFNASTLGVRLGFNF